MRTLVALIVLTVAAIAGVRAQPTPDAALEMVRSLQLGTNLSGMTYRMAPLTQTWAAVVVAVGPKKAEELLRSEIAVVAPKYQREWDMNLALAWAPLMTADEFRSVAQLRQGSPYIQKFARLQNEAGTSMKASSEPLLARVLGEVMNGVFARSQKEK